MKKAKTKVINYRLEDVSSDRLEVLRNEYQKPLNKKRVAQIVAHFDENIANEPKVNFRDGHYYVFDGQHTVAARVQRNKGKNLLIKCKVYHDLTKEEEANLFAQQTGFASKPTPSNRLRALLYAGELEALAFNEATQSAGFVLDLDGSRSKNHILCINTALNQFRKAGADVYKEALGIMAVAWEGSPDSLLSEIIIAVTEFVKLYRGKYNSTRLIALLHKSNPKTISRNIKTDFEHPGKKKYIFQIYRIYNNGNGGVSLPMSF